MKNYRIVKNACILALLTAVAILIAGYHPGAEDDAVYLSAIKRDLNPILFPHDSDFFTVQLQATIFDKVIAASIRLSHLSSDWMILVWHFATIFLVLLGCWRVSRRCFSDDSAQWASVTLIAVLLTLPVAGSALYIVDQNLHPRALATSAILAAVVATLDRKAVLAGAMLFLAALMHPIMASFGISFCFFLVWPKLTMGRRSVALAAAPLGWILEPTSPAWRVAANTRDYYFLSRWQWYEWLGVIAPLAILWWFRRIGQKEAASTVSHVASRLILFGIFQMIVAVALMLPDSLQRIRPLQPMRYLHLLYIIFLVLAGGLIEQKFLRARWTRWALLFLPLSAGMVYAQRQTYPGSSHLEWPGSIATNPWLQAFSWIRQNTPSDAYFAAGAYYMKRPGEDYYSFRALAERSILADAVKDSAVATQVPPLAQRWQDEVEAQRNWDHFSMGDLSSLKNRFGVEWVILERPGIEGLNCPYGNSSLLVCHVPEE